LNLRDVRLQAENWAKPNLHNYIDDWRVFPLSHLGISYVV
jgi:hypothetical protein